ncbi:MAG TPA: NAD(P)H-dependent glycerol-3-phosphate dehydrogenase [Casimicrobiaceae bacterium]|nr:NAD(P)H-dependent glycerol-3-phosphate dehydrogenase [Casimicrobiaceae bacterium]
MTRVCVLGAGAFGTALAVHLATRALARPAVVLYARDAAHAAMLRGTRRNARYLPGHELPPAVEVTADLAAALDAQLLIAAVPARNLATLVDACLVAGAKAPLVWVTKGFVAAPAPPFFGLIHASIAPRWPAAVGALSGPSFALEVAQGLPTALAMAATDDALADEAAALLRGDTLRVYPSGDLAGVETGGAIKNVLAIAAGASDGLGFGDNARAALITRGLAETGRLSAALGGRRDTVMGLAGLGDLVLTCTGDLSRNRQVGLALARGEQLDDILARLGHVAEGVGAARAARALAHHHALAMPIVEAVHRVLYEAVMPAVAVRDLLRREPRSEAE